MHELHELRKEIIWKNTIVLVNRTGKEIALAHNVLLTK